MHSVDHNSPQFALQIVVHMATDFQQHPRLEHGAPDVRRLAIVSEDLQQALPGIQGLKLSRQVRQYPPRAACVSV